MGGHMVRTIGGMTSSKPTTERREVTREEIQGHIAAFEVAHPGFGRSNYPDAFRDERGELVESEEFFAIDGWYALLEASE